MVKKKVNDANGVKVYDATYFRIMKDLVRRSVSANKGKPWYLRYGSPAWKLFWDEANAAHGYLQECGTMEEATDALEMLRLYVESPRPEAKMLYGAVLMFKGKPWYDMETGLRLLREAAVEGRGHGYPGGWCMFIYGITLLNGSHGYEPRRNEAKYWVKEAEREGFADAGRFRRMYWHE